MERKNYFELLGLPFDPPINNEDKINKAIENWSNNLDNELGNATDDMKRKALQTERAMKQDICNVMLNPTRRATEAKEIKTQRLNQLDKLLDIFLTGVQGTPEVTNARIINVSNKLGLRKNSVEDQYKKRGIRICELPKRDVLNNVFISPTSYKGIQNNLEKLRQVSKPNDLSKYPWLPKLRNLYDLISFLNDPNGDPEVYRKKNSEDLGAIADAIGVRMANDLSEVGKDISGLVAKAKTFVFSSSENQRKYDNSIKLEELEDFFSLLKGAPDSFKKDPSFATHCISHIQKYFNDQDVALALYNREAGLGLDPYEPMDTAVYVTCASCHTISRFETLSDAQRSKCPTCGSPLYIHCPSCDKLIPAVAERCSCGFSLLELAFFEDYLRDAERALTKMEIDEAERLLDKAQKANPKDNRLTQLQNRLKGDKEKYYAPLKPLKDMITAGKYLTAQAELEKIAAANPKLPLESQRKTISERLKAARTAMPRTGAAPSPDTANQCLDVLMEVSDYTPALDFLRQSGCEPRTPRELRYAISNKYPLSCSLTWHAAGDRGISYRVVRKRNGVPGTYTDGDILAENCNSLEFKDTSLEPGVNYGYAVFARRDVVGVFSSPATCQVIAFCDLDEHQLQASAENGFCSIQWVLPKNCLGIRILRRTGGIPSSQPNGTTQLIEEKNTTGHLEDKKVENGIAYCYRLQCIYSVQGNINYSSGICTKMLIPDQPPVALKDVKIKKNQTLITVTWTPGSDVERTVTVRECISTLTEDFEGKLLSESELQALLGTGRVLAQAGSRTRQCCFSLQLNQSLHFAVVVGSGSKGIISYIGSVSTVEQCEIDRSLTVVDGSRLRIVLKKIPSNLYAIHYLVAQKVSDRIPWASSEDARNGRMERMTVAEYKKNEMIYIDNPAKAQLFISIISEYCQPNGEKFYSEPSKLRLSNEPKTEMHYRMIWKSTNLLSREKRGMLYIRCKSEETPKLKLVYCDDGHIPMQAEGPKIHTAHIVEATETGYTNGEYRFTFVDNTFEKIGSGKQLRLMFADRDDRYDYELIIDDINSLKVPEQR